MNHQNQQPRRLYAQDVIKQFAAPTCTFVYRNHVVTLPDWFTQVRYTDKFLVFLLSKHGAVYFLDEPLAKYNHHHEGMGSKTDRTAMLYGDSLLYYRVADYHEGNDAVRKVVWEWNAAAVSSLFHRRAFLSAVRLFWRLPLRELLSDRASRASTVKLFLKTHFLLFLSKNDQRKVY